MMRRREPSLGSASASCSSSQEGSPEPRAATPPSRASWSPASSSAGFSPLPPPLPPLSPPAFQASGKNPAALLRIRFASKPPPPPGPVQAQARSRSWNPPPPPPPRSEDPDSENSKRVPKNIANGANSAVVLPPSPGIPSLPAFQASGKKPAALLRMQAQARSRSWNTPPPPRSEDPDSKKSKHVPKKIANSANSAVVPPPPPGSPSPLAFQASVKKPAALLRSRSTSAPPPPPRSPRAQARSRSWNPSPPPPPHGGFRQQGTTKADAKDPDSKKSKRGLKNTTNVKANSAGGYVPTPLAIVLGAVSLAALLLLTFRAVVLYQDYYSHRHNHHHHRHYHSLHHHFRHHSHGHGGGEEAILKYNPLPFRVDDLEEVARRSPHLSGSKTKPRGNEGVVFSAWIYLNKAKADSSDDNDSEDGEEHEKHDREEVGERIIFSTGGLDPSVECDKRSPSYRRSEGTAREAGMALYVNPPTAGQLADRLILAYRSSDSSGCMRLVSTGRNAEVEEDEWVHVALEITPQGNGEEEEEEGGEMIKLFVNGRQVTYLVESHRLKPPSEGRGGGKTALSGTASGMLELGGDVGMLGVWSTAPEQDEDSSDAEHEHKHEHWDPHDLIDELFDAEFELDEVRETFPEGRVTLLELDADIEEGSEDQEGPEEGSSTWRRLIVAGRSWFRGDL